MIMVCDERIVWLDYEEIFLNIRVFWMRVVLIFDFEDYDMFLELNNY